MMKLLSTVAACITLILTASGCGRQNTVSGLAEKDSSIPVTNLSASVQSSNESVEYQFVKQDVHNLQNYLLTNQTEDLSGKPYDLNGDGKWTAVDLTLMKQKLLPDTVNDTLVIYFSRTGNTEKIAQYLVDLTDADSYVIEAAVPYTDPDIKYQDDTCRANREQND